MLDIRYIRQNPDMIRQAAAKKRFDFNVDELIALDDRRRQLQQELDGLRHEQKKAGELIGQLRGKGRKKGGVPADAADAEARLSQTLKRMEEVKARCKALEEEAQKVQRDFDALMLRVPQVPDPDAPVGKDETENVEVKRWGEVRKFDFEPKDHATLGAALGMIDIDRGVKLAGSRSYFLLGAGTLMHQAVLRLAFDLMIERGFVPMTVPVIVREPAMTGTGYFPLGREQAYEMANEDPGLFLVGTAEVSLTSYHMDEVLDVQDLPRKYVGMSSCFRRETGTYGKDTAGIYRIHQFDKVEQVVICRGDVDESKRWHQAILENAEAVVQKLELPYRVVAVCTGDLGIGQSFKYDIETWMPSRNAYGETHSASRFYDFQARRLNMRYRDADGKLQFCHTLNNTVIASPRILIPIMELYQNADGSITVPQALRPYMGGMERIGKVTG
jgi:seryl-tRNA synthetase